MHILNILTLLKNKNGRHSIKDCGTEIITSTSFATMVLSIVFQIILRRIQVSGGSMGLTNESHIDY